MEEAIADVASRIDRDVSLLRDLVSLTPDPPEAGRLNSPQDAWVIVVDVLQVPGRLANVLDELSRYLCRNAVDFAVDGGEIPPQERAFAAADSLHAAAEALSSAMAPLHDGAKLLSRLRLTPAAAAALADALGE
ncbi:MAG: hypothetical protein ACRDJU_08410 [Actinomycetota bacterium]